MESLNSNSQERELHQLQKMQDKAKESCMFQTFINSRFSFDDDDGLMIRKYFIAHTRTDVQQFCVTLIQRMESVKKLIEKRAQHKREYDSRVNERQMQLKKERLIRVKH
ncbi:hypothetical protein Tco_0544191 [Tanacetum coccineum]